MTDVGVDLFQTEAGWKSIVEQEKGHIANIATADQLALIIVNLFCATDPLGLQSFESPMRVVMCGALHHPENDEFRRAVDEFSKQVGIVAVAGNAIASITATEAWMSSSCNPQPRNDPKRKEGLVLQAVHREFGSEAWFSLIDRDDGKRRLQPWRCGEAFDLLFGQMSFTSLAEVSEETRNKAQMFARDILLKKGRAQA